MDKECPCYALGFNKTDFGTVSTAFPNFPQIVSSLESYSSTSCVYEAASGVVANRVGCYTNKFFKKGSLITVCEGGILIPALVWQPKQCSRFSWTCEHLTYCMRFSSHPSRIIRNSQDSNVKLDWIRFAGIPCIIATTDIDEGTELLAPYTYGQASDQVTALRAALKDEDVVDDADINVTLVVRSWKQALGRLAHEYRAKIKANLAKVGTFEFCKFHKPDSQSPCFE